MSSRFKFPPVNLAGDIEKQLIWRADWVGFTLLRLNDNDGVRWKLIKRSASVPAEVYVLSSLCEIDMKLCALLDGLGERLQRAEAERAKAARAVAEEANRRLLPAIAE